MTAQLCVLVALDLSDAANGALREARQLADGLAARLEIVHVAEDVGEEDAATEAALRDWLERHGSISDVVVMRRGLPWLELVRYAADRRASVLVVGSHGRSGFQPLTLGSTAAKLALAAPCPVLVVGPRAGRPSKDLLVSRGR